MHAKALHGVHKNLTEEGHTEETGGTGEPLSNQGNPAELKSRGMEPIRPADEQEHDILRFVQRRLKEYRARKATGQLLFEFNVRDGGITSKWATERIQEK
jgi:hypothetical protein